MKNKTKVKKNKNKNKQKSNNQKSTIKINKHIKTRKSLTATTKRTSRKLRNRYRQYYVFQYLPFIYVCSFTFIINGIMYCQVNSTTTTTRQFITGNNKSMIGR